jgi:hypothetical protein
VNNPLVERKAIDGPPLSESVFDLPAMESGMFAANLPHCHVNCLLLFSLVLFRDRVPIGEFETLDFPPLDDGEAMKAHALDRASCVDGL